MSQILRPTTALPLLQSQHLLGRLLPRLLDEVYNSGYRVSLAEALRTKEMVDIYTARGSGSSTSVHPLKLAIDLDLFDKGDNYLTKTEDHYRFGVYWERLHTLTRWGGRFPKPDGNHYSIAFWDEGLERWRA